MSVIDWFNPAFSTSSDSCIAPWATPSFRYRDYAMSALKLH